MTILDEHSEYVPTMNEWRSKLRQMIDKNDSDINHVKAEMYSFLGLTAKSSSFLWTVVEEAIDSNFPKEKKKLRVMYHNKVSSVSRPQGSIPAYAQPTQSEKTREENIKNQRVLTEEVLPIITGRMRAKLME
jgi:hypothetical protein